MHLDCLVRRRYVHNSRIHVWFHSPTLYMWIVHFQLFAVLPLTKDKVMVICSMMERLSIYRYITGTVAMTISLKTKET